MASDDDAPPPSASAAASVSASGAPGKPGGAGAALPADAALAAAVRQLDLAVREQEQAVTRILGLIELLQAHAPDRATRARLDGVVEACAFQDLTGQRITKVSRLLRALARDLGPRSVGPTPDPDPPGPAPLSQEEVDRLLRGGKG